MTDQAPKNKEAGNRAERTACRWGLKHTTGLHEDVKEIATSTGRVGNYANLEIDGVFVEYSLECKSRKKLPEWLRYGIVEQAVAASKRFRNHPLVVLYSKTLPIGYRWWHMITPERHAYLLMCERMADIPKTKRTVTRYKVTSKEEIHHG
jgi:hypothetical protein